jgi:heme A synthase
MLARTFVGCIELNAHMKESRFGFEYSWADLQPVRLLALIVLGSQVAGGLAGLAYPQFPKWFESMWFASAICTFPSFLIGLVAQARLRPGSIVENRIMVRRLGLISLALSAFAVAMPVLGFGK